MSEVETSPEFNEMKDQIEAQLRAAVLDGFDLAIGCLRQEEAKRFARMASDILRNQKLDACSPLVWADYLTSVKNLYTENEAKK